VTRAREQLRETASPRSPVAAEKILRASRSSGARRFSRFESKLQLFGTTSTVARPYAEAGVQARRLGLLRSPLVGERAARSPQFSRERAWCHGDRDLPICPNAKGWAGRFHSILSATSRARPSLLPRGCASRPVSRSPEIRQQFKVLRCARRRDRSRGSVAFELNEAHLTTLVERLEKENRRKVPAPCIGRSASSIAGSRSSRRKVHRLFRAPHLASCSTCIESRKDQSGPTQAVRNPRNSSRAGSEPRASRRCSRKARGPLWTDAICPQSSTACPTRMQGEIA